MITGNKVTTHSESARRFVAAVATSANGTRPRPAPAPAAVSAAAASRRPDRPGASSGDVHTFPMEDSHPGGEPH